jgi:PBP1b-binding outer membrane lipoprotein LpoB
MLKYITFFIFLLFFLSACQTQKIQLDTQIKSIDDCPKHIEKIDLADIDYLLYANRMIDSMILDEQVKAGYLLSRVTLYIHPIQTDNKIYMDISTLNQAIYNRIVRSGKFIIVNNIEQSNYQLLANIASLNANMKQNCSNFYETLSLELKNTDTHTILWSDRKVFSL